MSSTFADETLQDAARIGRLRRRVAGFMASDQLDRLVIMWRACLQQRAHCSVPAFVTKVASELGLADDAASRLRIVLFGEVLAKPNGAPPACGKTPAVAPPVKDDLDEAGAVYVALLGALDRFTRERHANAWAMLVRVLTNRWAAHTSIPFSTGSLVRGETMPGDLARRVRPADRQAMLHQYYLGLCEVIGPADADQRLSDAVIHAGRLPEAARHKPGQWL